MIRIGLIGGGRWGQILHGVLNDLLTGDDQIIWLSQHMTQARCQKATASSVPTRIAREPNAFWSAEPTGVIVASEVASHAAHAFDAIERRVPALIEKPLAATVDAAEALTRKAAATATPLGVNLEYLSASYLHALAELFPWQDVERLEITWIDPWVEHRGGAVKVADLTTNRGLDIVPHLWSILDVLSGGQRQNFRKAEAGTMQGSAQLALMVGSMPVTAQVSRHGTERVRKLDYVLKDGDTASLDFSTEPGTLTRNGAIVHFDSGWDAAPSPLTTSLSAFLGQVRHSGGDWHFDATRTLGHIHLSAAAADAIAATDIAQAASLLNAGHQAGSPELQATLRELLLPELAQTGHVGQVRRIARDPDACSVLAKTVLDMVARTTTPDAELEAMLGGLEMYRRLQGALG